MKTPRFSQLFGDGPTALIGMIHVRALPGTPQHAGGMAPLIEHALAEADTYCAAGIHALMIENMHDLPYLRQPGPEVVAAMSVLARAVKQAHPTLPLGIQILAGANREALAAALAADADFIRAEGFVFGHVADEGYIDACAGDLLRHRKAIGADHIALFTDIKKKHSAHAITADVDIVQTAHAAEFFLSDGLILTGAATGEAASLTELRAVCDSTRLPVMVGSGITADNIRDYAALADALIVGSYVKEGGYWAHPLEPSRIHRLLDALG
ncbi:MAG: BtpA/SgcQ family protein [Kiritimatiellae bacterium]|jgi:membrane complex biogenesis BtpA family protein|nr:BtpA/SgcQ family protein [Kiritimatiellia bacterium]MDY0150481.1 BtpA/SgcQ family protein [Kiritimatiellia bacterium]